NEEIKAEFEVPFTDMQQLLYLKQHMFEMISKLKPEQSLDGGDDGQSLFPGMGNGAGAPGMSGAGKLLNPAQDGFTFSIEHRVISNKINDKEGSAAAFASDSMQMIKQMIPFIGDFNYKTTFILPSPVKKFSGGAESKLSDDKKTISFMNSLSGVLEKPESLEYSVEY
ncbi:MAG: hypothetical protein ABI861_05845, partial [Panacibacter sp.]